MIGGRSPKMDDDTFDILSEEAIRVYLLYYDQLKLLFTQHVHPNFNARPKKVVSWRDIEDKNTVMVVSAFLKMCRTNHLIPNMLNVEALHSFVQQTIPPITPEEYSYFENTTLLNVYNNDMNPEQTTCEPAPGEPGLLFHEFIFLLGLIALNFMGTSPQTSQSIEDFFVEKLNFTRVAPDARLKTYDELKDDSGIYSDEEDDSGSELEMDEQQKAFMEFLRERAE